MTHENETQEHDFAADVAKQREARVRESTLVFNTITSIATPLARAYRSMSATGLLNTRYQLYLDTVEMLINGKHMIPFEAHDVSIPALLTHIWRTTDVA